ncbi:MAG TPA: acetyl-CoA carboxylase biotin carboxyl carrier protein subunit, partial [Candidatus Saccharimonadales bacterium]|nr:acetyl-CoA carboxylase biotin carboxyl carrier protein subunit [Candidatus Saccharimonadales bacterium]
QAPVGTVVAAGDPVMTLEAMKMEHVVTSSTDGTVSEVVVAVGEQVRRGQVLATVDPPAADAVRSP